MEVTLASRLKNAWNAFRNKSQPNGYQSYYGTYSRPDRRRMTRGNERSIVTSVINRIALDVAAIDIKHCRVDDNDRFKEEVDSGLNNCLTLEANLDQTSKALIQDLVISLLDEGCAALVPIDTSDNPAITNSYDIYTMRVGKIVEWHPYSVKVYIYNDRTGKKEEIYLRKDKICIIENPLYAVMNEPNSTLQRLIRKLILLDGIDEQSSSGKLDLIIQLPYVIKSQSRRDQANERRLEIERQLAGSKYGIAYTDGTEKITQLNRPVENNLMKQIEYLTSMLYGQLGITQSILDGTANEETMLNYYSRTIEPIVTAIALEIKRKFLTKTARTQGQSILYFRNPFKLAPVKDLAELADKFTRNEILSSNEVRGVLGYRPSNDPRADQLINSNVNQSANRDALAGGVPPEQVLEDNIQDDQSGMISDEAQTSQEYMDQVYDTLNDEQKQMVEYLLNQVTDDE